MRASTSTHRTVYRFDDILLDVDRRHVSRNGDPVELGKLSFEMLVLLAEAAPAIVTHQELETRLWAGRVVHPAAIKQRVGLLRNGLSDDASDPRYIRVVRGQGYGLIPVVEKVAGGPRRSFGNRKFSLGAAVGVLVVVIAISTLWNARNAGVDRNVGIIPNSVAVLPLENLSPDLDDAYFASGIHEELINQLTSLRSLSVIAKTSVDRYSSGQTSISEVARELNVATVMQGSVRYADDRVRITVQLIEPDNGVTLWSAAYERDFSDIFTIQADIARNIAQAMEAEFSFAELGGIEAVRTNSPVAYALYLRALETGEVGRQTLSIQDLDAAIALDPDFAVAHALRAWRFARSLLFGAEVSVEEYERGAVESANRALALDPTIGLAYSALAAIDDLQWRWTDAYRKAELAFELSPNDANVWKEYLRFTRSAGEYEKSLSVNNRWLLLDPNSSDLHYQLALTSSFMKNFDTAFDAARSAIEIDPTVPHYRLRLAIAEVGRGNFAEAEEELHTVELLYGGQFDQVFRIGQIALAYSQIGEYEAVDRLFVTLEEYARSGPVGDAVWAQAYLARGQYDQAYRHLESAMRGPSSRNSTTLIELKTNFYSIPELDSPRFRDLLDGFWSIE